MWLGDGLMRWGTALLLVSVGALVRRERIGGDGHRFEYE
jgi:hypothetical protein